MDLGGYRGIVPGSLEKSELHQRIRSTDSGAPPKSKLKLTAKEKDLLDRWIQQGAQYDGHWAFQTPVRLEFPKLSQANQKWVRNGIDHFVAARLETKGLEPSVEASREALIRRVTLDLTGLPATPEEVRAFIADKRSEAYGAVVDRLLKTKHYGERMALVWLDAARYADSGGYQGDTIKSQWPWRDWVIGAYNANFSFDRFTIEQLAGDLFPNPTDEQLLATAFNRNHRINDEGGIIPAEFLVEYVADRVETTSTVWMGLTVGCARCHDHKYDPIKQKEFYEMFAFFHNIPENGKDGNIAPKPNMRVFTGGTKADHQKLKDDLAAQEQELTQLPKTNAGNFEAWLAQRRAAVDQEFGIKDLPVASLHFPFDALDSKVKDARNVKREAVIVRKQKDPTLVSNLKFGGGFRIGAVGYLRVASPHGPKGYTADRANSWSVWLKTPPKMANVEGPLVAASEDDATQRGYRIVLEESGDNKPYRVSFRLYEDRKKKNGIEVRSEPVVPRKEFVNVVVTWDGTESASGVRIYVGGKLVKTSVVVDQLNGAAASKEPLLIGASSIKGAKLSQRDAVFRRAEIDDIQIYDLALDPEQVLTVATTAPEELLVGNADAAARTYLSKIYFAKYHPDGLKLVAKVAKTKQQLEAFEKNDITYVSIMEEMPKARPTYLLVRGAYDNPQTEELLRPTTFRALPPMKPGQPSNRLGLAQWLFQADHPLTARVAVNRYWQMYFGQGLVRTPEDFGSQGESPTHPKLLDWLAVTFRESGWDVKAMQKLIVSSATYRQSSRISPKLLEMDPNNKLVARGPRFRLYGQALRDQALAVSGLLERKIGGKPVMPYQPAGLWEEVSAKGFKYIVGNKKSLYRRSLYTFWRRTVPPPSMMNFDNSAREICSVRATRTNTPLQAINLMNDPQFVEAARAMAERMMKEGGKTVADRIGYGHRLVLARAPDDAVLKILQRGYEDYLATYKKAPERAKAFVSVGKSKRDQSLNVVELAANTAIASVILNLDEAVTKE